MKYDAVIIGAGPSGSFCALNLARKGIKVLIIDKCSFPREKACGGLISKNAMDLLKRHTLTIDINHNIINKICLIGKNEEQAVIESRTPLGIIVKRKEFDQFLARKAVEAGADFIDNCRFESCILESAGYKIQTARGNFYADYLIGADGCFSKVARASNIRKRWSKWEKGIALCAHVPDEYVVQKRVNAVEFCFPDVLAGIGWCFPGNNYYNIGVGGTVFDSKRIISAFKLLLEKNMKDKKSLSNLKYNAAFLPAGGRFRKISDKRIFLLGDAAGFVDAFSGEGIYYALRSAEILSDVINQNKDGREYEKRCYETFLGEFRLSAFLSVYFGNKKHVFQKGMQERFLKAICMIMTQTPESMRYKKVFDCLITGGFSFNVAFLWLKRLILD
ncbi:MAG: NAD(P)/FAD-dependent oxidoreductase [Tepidanaerobacteraceae bacterium]|nr:NAD(P)/FAD-dependent oxidoreductase [Tepidanaerobacteraceae bacterium]